MYAHSITLGALWAHLHSLHLSATACGFINSPEKSKIFSTISLALFSIGDCHTLLVLYLPAWQYASQACLTFLLLLAELQASWQDSHHTTHRLSASLWHPLYCHLNSSPFFSTTAARTEKNCHCLPSSMFLIHRWIFALWWMAKKC